LPKRKSFRWDKAGLITLAFWDELFTKAAVPVLLVLANDTGKPAASFDLVQQAPPNDFRRRPDPFAITGGAAGVDR